MRARGSAWLLWQYFDTHKAAICMAAQKGRLSSIFNKQQISACKEGEGWRGEGRGGEGRGGEGRGGTKERNKESVAGEYGLLCKHVLVFAPVYADLTCWTVRLSIDSFRRLVLGGFVLRVLHSTSRLHPLLPAPWARGETSKGRRGEEEVPEQCPAVLCPHTAYRQ